MCDVDRWLSGRVSALHSVVTGSISSGGNHGIHCWWDLIRPKQLSSVSVCRTQVFAGFSGHGNSIHNIISLLKKKNVRLKPLMNKSILKKWQKFWDDQTQNKLHHIRDTIGEWPAGYRSNRKEEVIISRLYIGHTHITHSHLLKREDPPQYVQHAKYLSQSNTFS